MAYTTSSNLGVDLANSSSTQLFTLNQVVHGSDHSEWQYVYCSATIATGALVVINAAGTAVVANTARLTTPAGTGGYSLGVTQFAISQGHYGFVAKRGHNMIIACSGMVTPGNALHLGELYAITTATTSATLAGIYITYSSTAAGINCSARAILTYPRCYAADATPLG